MTEQHTELLYQTDSYLQEFTATVIAADENARTITLDRTAFYPGGGGQPHDIGLITYETGEANGKQHTYRVDKVQKVGDVVLHTLAGEWIPLPPIGATVEGRIDWEHRYKLMRTHSAMHVLCGVIFRDHGAQVTGGNMKPLGGRMDFEFENLHGDFVKQVEEAINKEVAADRPIRVNILPREEAFQIPDLIRTKINLLPEGIQRVRTVEIVGLDLQADGGTHVRSTSEIGQIRIANYESKGKINKRIHIELA
jgi:misacylated tRNA(Ala) deacylase